MFLKHMCIGPCTDAALNGLLKRLVEEGYLTEDRKEKRIHLVGYCSTSKAVDLIHEFYGFVPIGAETDVNVEPIPKYECVYGKPLKKPSNMAKPMPVASIDPEALALQKRIETAKRILDEAEQSVIDTRESIRRKSNDLARRKARIADNAPGFLSPVPSLDKLALQICVLQTHEKEEARRAAKAREAYEALQGKTLSA
jgi:hypothetical protein